MSAKDSCYYLKNKSATVCSNLKVLNYDQKSLNGRAFTES